MLRDGDLIKIGRTIFKFLTGGNIENAYHEEIYRLTTVDGLTQIFNKRYFLETLEREIARAHRYRRDAVAGDVRHRSLQEGQRQLRPPRRRLRAQAPGADGASAKIRREDCFARYGGEEFAIVLPEIDGANALPFAEKIRQIVEKTEFKFEDTRIPVTISIGVASIDGEPTESAAIIKRADERLYEAKASGRNRVCAVARPPTGPRLRRAPSVRRRDASHGRLNDGSSVPSSSSGCIGGFSVGGFWLLRRLSAADVGTSSTLRADAGGAGGRGLGRRRLDLAQRREQRRRQVGDDVDRLLLEAGLPELELDRRVAVGDLDRQRRQAQRLAVAAQRRSRRPDRS